MGAVSNMGPDLFTGIVAAVPFVDVVTTSLPDSQVQYWEPAKWVARLRALKRDDHRLLLRTKIEAGHGGVSGPYKRYKETAFIYAFLLDVAGIEA
jgi:oligopeptidase B